MLKIFYLKHTEIDKERWDAAIGVALNALPYAYSWYLNAVSPGWEALVSEDYDYVMPLPVKRKYGVRYLIEPSFVQQLGVFAAVPLSTEVVEQFRKAIPYKSYDFNLNYGNVGDYRTLPNAIIDLRERADSIRGKFSKNTHRNIAKAIKSGLEVKAISHDEFLRFWREHSPCESPVLAEKLERLCCACDGAEASLYYGVQHRDGYLVAALFLVYGAGRLIYLAPASSQVGKESSAMFLLIDYMIRQYSEQPLILDFEGSQIEGIRRFYAGFGAIAQPYYTINKMRPQWLVKLINRQ